MYDRIPSVDALVNAPRLTAVAGRVPRAVVVDAAREVLGELRAAISADRLNGSDFEPDHLAARVADRLEQTLRPPLIGTINATGIILHTGLGRAPLADEAVAALHDVAGRYAAVELELISGERNRRADLVRPLLTRLTGAESATVVNNNAAATLLVLAAVACGRGVIVSRGELIEIGGSFRLPDVMSAGGAILREVGTTNRTRLSDYESAIDESTAALMKVHTSNYRIEGFTEDVSIASLVALGRRRGLPVVHDIGSGLLRSIDHPALADEPDAAGSISAGADLVLFSGDKLLGGPQCGIIVGSAAWIERIEVHPLMRAMRVDKLTLAALAATLQLHRDPQQVRQRLPIYRMLDIPPQTLRQRAEEIANSLRKLPSLARIDVRPSVAYFGGGSMPTKQITSVALVLAAKDMNEDDMAREFRTGTPPLIPRVQQGAVWLDLRTVLPEQDEQLINTITTALGHGAAHPATDN